MMDNKKTRRKYRLHYMSRKAGFALNSKKRTIYIPTGEEYPNNKHVIFLIDEYGYVVQTFIK